MSNQIKLVLDSVKKLRMDKAFMGKPKFISIKGPAGTVAKAIEQGLLDETTDLLKNRDIRGDRITVAHILADHSDKTGWSTNDPKILALADAYGGTVAHRLASKADKTGWTTDDPKILKLRVTDSPETQNLGLHGATVAHILAWNAPKWTPRDKSIGELKDGRGRTVLEILNRGK